jgi:hypothetical protein
VTYFLAVEYKPYSDETDDLVFAYAQQGEFTESGTWIQTQVRELGFVFTLALPAAVAKALIEKLPGAKAWITIEDDSPFSTN